MLFHIAILFSTLWLPLAFANTEIVNFEATTAIGYVLPLVEDWSIFSPQDNEKRFNVTPAPLGTLLKHVCAGPEDLLSTTPQCPHEIWLKLDLDRDSWKSFSKFTLRISWPASSPADFSIDIYDPEQVATRFQVTSAPSSSTQPEKTRIKYARIRLVDTGIRTPTASVEPDYFPSVPVTAKVPFIVIVEPLYLGVIPESVLLLGKILLPLLVALVFVVPRVNVYIDGLAKEIRKELAGKKE